MMRLGCLVVLAAWGCAPATPSDGGAVRPTGGAAAASAIEPAASAAGPQAASLVPQGPRLDVSGVKPLLDDARFAKAKEAVKNERYAEAGREALAVADAGVGADADEKAAMLYLAGSLFERAGAPGQARAAYRRAAENDLPTRAVALLRLVEIAARGGEHAEAVALSKEIDDKVVPKSRVDDAIVESLVRTGALADARARYAGLVDGSARPNGWTTLALRLAKALLSKPGADRAADALALASAVARSGPNGRGADEADKLVKQAIGLLPKEEREKYTSPAEADQVTAAESLVLANQHKRAIAILDRLAKKSLPAELACRVAFARGRAFGAVKRSGEGLDELERAADLCAGKPQLAEVLWSAGRAAARAGADDRARALYGRLEAAAPEHRLADDARLEGARAALGAGDRDAFARMLDAMPNDYPEGDMTGDGIFLRAVEAMERGAYAEAKVHLAKGAARAKERAYHRAGRFTYFLGRASVATGNAKEGRAYYEQTLREYPLGYYAALTIGRLDRLESGSGRAAFAATLTGSPGSSVPEMAEADGADPPVRAAIAVARAGDARGLDDVFGSFGVKQRSATAAELLFAARLYAITGDLRRAHAVLRTASELEPKDERKELWALRDEPPRGDWRAVWELAYPRPFAREVTAASIESDVPEALLYAIMREESAFAPEAVSKSDARGLFQAIPATGAKMARSLGIKMKADTLFDPASSARIGARYLAGMRKRFGNAPVLSVPGYNAGPGAPEAWLNDRPGWDFDLWVEKIPYAETRGYTKRVLSSLFTYEALYGDGLVETSGLPIRL